MYGAILKRAHQEKASELIITLVCIIVYQEFIKITIITRRMLCIMGRA